MALDVGKVLNASKADLSMSFDVAAAQSSLNDLKSNPAGTAEISSLESSIAEMKPISDRHEQHPNLAGLNEIVSTYESANEDYNALIGAVEHAINEVNRVDIVDNIGGNVTGGSGGSGGGGGGTPIIPYEPKPYITPTPTITWRPTPTPTITWQPTPTPTITWQPTPTPTITWQPTPSPSPTVSPTPTATITPTTIPTATPTGISGPDPTPTITSSLILPIAPGTNPENPINPGNEFGDQVIGADTWSELTPQEQTAVQNKLKELGFSDDEINAIMSGSASAPSLVTKELSSVLEQNLQANPELRNELINKYGFDIFNEDGTVNEGKLAMALVMDNKNGMDDYSMIELLHGKGIDIVNQVTYDELVDQLTTLVTKYPEIRSDLIAKYGFDIFNTDGTINRDKLTLAMLMDGQDSADDFDLLTYLTNTYGESGTSDFITKVTPIVTPTPKKSSAKSGTGIVTTLAGVSLLGATGAGLALLSKKKKDEEEEESKLENGEDEELSDSSTQVSIDGELDEEEGDKEWLYGLGLGLAAKQNNVEYTETSDNNNISMGASNTNLDDLLSK